MSDGVTQIVDVYRVDPEGGEGERVGQVAFGADGRLDVLDADPDVMARLEEAVRSVNGKGQITELVPPEDAPEKFQTAARVTSRDDPDFFDALSRYMETYYGFSLG
jgi:hypothetical protein